MVIQTADFSTLNLVGGRICLDFANTVSSHGPEHPNERLSSYADLIHWSRRAELLDDQDQARLERLAAERPDAAALAFEQAFNLRETIYRIFSAVAQDRMVDDLDLVQFNSALQAVMQHAELVQTEHGFEWDWTPDEEALDRILWPIVRSAADLLTSGDLGRVRECSGETCAWLFVDTSRNRSRRWCDMEDCGNRAKARRHYHRKRAAEQPET